MKHLFIMLTLLVGIVSAEWLIETVDSSDGFTSIVLDSSNKPHISYVDYGYGIVKYAYLNGVSWQIEIADDVSGGFLVLCWSSISLDSLENPHIAYTKSAGWTADLRYAQRISSTWQTETVDFNGGYYTSITLDSSNHPHIAYAGYYGMRHAYWGGSAWQLETADELENYGFRFPSIVLDTSDYPHISYYDYHRCNLKFARWDGLTWQVEIVDSVHAVGMYTSLDLDSTGNPHIAYYDESVGDLKYAHFDGSTWHIETVDSNGDVGKFTSLKLDSSGNPHISYYDDTYDRLRYAQWNGSVWQSETVDSDGSVGEYTSLDLDTSGHAHISYFDYTNWTVKYAQEYETGIEHEGNTEGYFLLPLNPNPVSGTFALEFSVPENAIVELSIYDMSGRLVKQIPTITYSSGSHQISFSGLKTGVYHCRMNSGDFTATQQFVVID